MYVCGWLFMCECVPVCLYICVFFLENFEFVECVCVCVCVRVRMGGFVVNEEEEKNKKRTKPQKQALVKSKITFPFFQITVSIYRLYIYSII